MRFARYFHSYASLNVVMLFDNRPAELICAYVGTCRVSRSPGRGCPNQIIMHNTQNSGLRTQNSGLRTQDSELRIQDSELRTQNSGLRTQDSELRTDDSELRTYNSEHTIRSLQDNLANSRKVRTYLMPYNHSETFLSCKPTEVHTREQK
jgi:hypothetical protein